jgi:putative tricarboxylic transport membrane protein
MDTASAMVLILAIFVGGIYGGSISSILLGTPGTPASAATAMDGFPLAKQGKSGKALEAALIASATGTVFSALILIFFTEPLANLAKMFGSKEYTILILLALSIVGSVCGKSLARGLMSAFLGLWFSTIGLDPLTYASRYSFGTSYLLGGFEMVVVMIGLLAVSELFGQLEQLYRKTKDNKHVSLLPPPSCRTIRSIPRGSETCAKTFAQLRTRCMWVFCRQWGLPLRPTWRRLRKAQQQGSRFLWQGNIEGVVASESANNAVCAAAMIPLLSFGIPGDATTAMMIGVFIMQGFYPGPTLFAKQPLLIYTIYAAFIVAAIVMVIEMKLAMSLFIKASQARMNVVFPCVIAACIIGSYVSRGNLMDPLVMIFFALIGWLFTKFSFPSTPMLIGFILGGQFEST